MSAITLRPGYCLPETITGILYDSNRRAGQKLRDVMFALGLNVSTRNTQLDDITADLDAGTGAALLRLYDGTRPATGGAATTLLAELTFSATSFPAASGGSMSANAISDDLNADASGTTTWFRCVDSDSNQVIDGDCGTSGSDINFNTVVISAGAIVSVTSFQLTAGNP